MEVLIDGDEPSGLRLTLAREGNRFGTMVRVNGIWCHLECLHESEFASYKVDSDPDYCPVTDEGGFTFLLVPFSR